MIITIGLEVHVQVKTNSKIFCSCPTGEWDKANVATCPVCLGYPGTLPVLNKEAVEKTILTGLMLGCDFSKRTNWDRKNYFYPDVAKNYQISQYKDPLCLGGFVPLYHYAYPKDVQKEIEKGEKKIALTRIHLEEDVGKSNHFASFSGVDFNRAGTPLMEIVSEPDITSAEEAVAYLNSLKQILIYGNISDADMEKGQLRCDVNISVRPEGQKELNPKVELKNLNSFSAIRRAIIGEAERQIEKIEDEEELHQETRRWNDELKRSEPMRMKEDAHDYRYFPEPDLLPLTTTPIVEKLRKFVPELPHERQVRFEGEYGITSYDAEVLTSTLPLANYYEESAKLTKNPKLLANWVINNVLSATECENEFPVSSSDIAELVSVIEEGKINSKQAKTVFEHMLSDSKKPNEIISKLGLEQISDPAKIEELVDKAIEENPDIVKKIKEGNPKLINFLKGQTIKASKGKANPQKVAEILEGKFL